MATNTLTTAIKSHYPFDKSDKFSSVFQMDAVRLGLRMGGISIETTGKHVSRELKLEHRRPKPIVCKARGGVGANHALSISISQYGYSSSGEESALNPPGVNYNVKTEGESRKEERGASCAWPRACEWPMKDSRSRSEMAKDAMSDAAAAATVSGTVNWTPEAMVYTRNDEIDTDLPPDVELLAFFSDNPIAWRPHDSDDESIDIDEPTPSFLDKVTTKAIKWWGKMWRYQGLGL